MLSMEPNTKLVGIAFLLALAIVAHEPKVVNAQKICGMTFEGLNACKPYASTPNPSNSPLDPSSPCCAALSQAKFKCLCNMKNSPFARGIDFGLASQLPARCGLPPFSCD